MQPHTAVFTRIYDIFRVSSAAHIGGRQVLDWCGTYLTTESSFKYFSVFSICFQNPVCDHENYGLKTKRQIEMTQNTGTCSQNHKLQ